MSTDASFPPSQKQIPEPLVATQRGLCTQLPPRFHAALPPQTQSLSHLVCLLNGCALNANLALAVTLLLLEGAWADLAGQDLCPDVVLLGQAQTDLAAAAGTGSSSSSQSGRLNVAVDARAREAVDALSYEECRAI